MFRLSKSLAIALALVLLVGQTLSFAVQQTHGTGSVAQVLVDEHGAPAHDDGKARDLGSLCHGCHFFSHFLGHIEQAPAGLNVPVGPGMPPLFAATPGPTVSLEPPYRPPRFSPLT